MTTSTSPSIALCNDHINPGNVVGLFPEIMAKVSRYSAVYRVSTIVPPLKQCFMSARMLEFPVAEGILEEAMLFDGQQQHRKSCFLIYSKIFLIYG